jgi:hypothetical protein
VTGNRPVGSRSADPFMRLGPFHVGREIELKLVNVDAFVKSRHPGENRGPEILQVPKKTGFRLSPE